MSFEIRLNGRGIHAVLGRDFSRVTIFLNYHDQYVPINWVSGKNHAMAAFSKQTMRGRLTLFGKDYFIGKNDK